ncbi:glycosyltransferase [Roseomonas sp. SXEYE002]|uniref:glycosyltransferase n=2 Tax=Roseomonas xinghualingensis TaxID=2986475 RepID=UPI0021F0B786|nr:glycosyltransferase [Roseomonas sp. SXEYE001]MCV4208363.1 glycosyltransferase [Roseomonas sp. SXEYE001]
MSVLHRIWSRLPRRLRREALFGTMAVLAPRPARPEPSGEGHLIVAGYHTATTGLGAGARRMLAAMRADGLDAIAADLTAAHRQEGWDREAPPMAVPPGPGTIILHVNGPMLPWALLALGRRAVAGKRLIAYWAWELPVLPADWKRGYAACHRIWAPSRFCAEAFSRPGHPPPLVVPHPPPVPDPAPLSRADFGLPDDAFVTLLVFDATSSLARKNPLGAIEAHRRAFGDDPGHVLVIKTHGTAFAGPGWTAVAEAAAERRNVRVMDAAMPRADLWALMAASDVLLSLHRSEGYGFAIAEMMELGRPVIATGWSGNTDFMLGPGCHAIGWRMIPARDPQGIYDMPEACWADPNLEEAAMVLRRIVGNPALRRPSPVHLPRPDYRAALGHA